MDTTNAAVPIQLLTPSQTFITTTWTLTILVLLTFTGMALWLTRKYLQHSIMNTEQFITARKSQPWVRIGWSFFTGGLGAWAISTPALYASFAGVLGLIAYAISTGIPILLIAFAGIKVHDRLPRPLSLSDFVLWRYGPFWLLLLYGILVYPCFITRFNVCNNKNVGRTTQVFVAFLCIFNMSMALISEYSTIGSIYAQFLKSSQYPIIIVVFVLTAGYTTYGGLFISIVTDQFQGLFVTLLALVMSGFLISTVPNLPPFPYDTLGPQYLGYVSLFTLPTSLIAATFFSEAMWQRIWAAESHAALRKGAIFGCISLITAVGVFGLCGLLATWLYAPSSDAQFANLYLFYVLGDMQYTWIGTVVVLLAVTMNMSAVDSLQNALAATVTANLFRSKSITWTRVVVLLINIPLLIMGFLTLPALNIFLVTNLLTTGALIPLVSGLLDIDRKYVSGYTMIFGSVCAMVALSVYGILTHDRIVSGLEWAWWSNNYDLFAFLALILGSIIGLCVWIGCAIVLERVFHVQGQGYTLEMQAVLDSMLLLEEQDKLDKAVHSNSTLVDEPDHAT